MCIKFIIPQNLDFLYVYNVLRNGAKNRVFYFSISKKVKILKRRIFGFLDMYRMS